MVLLISAMFKFMQIDILDFKNNIGFVYEKIVEQY